ncbi:MAG: hypothetical protein MZV65_31640 [Chromatiales bacterium]|nr:hypothetical protein [Chromatiales bacterium]
MPGTYSWPCAAAHPAHRLDTVIVLAAHPLNRPKPLAIELDGNEVTAVGDDVLRKAGPQSGGGTGQAGDNEGMIVLLYAVVLRNGVTLMPTST